MLTPLNLERDQHLQQQIFEQLRSLILSRRFASGARMPSTRMLAEQFNISRTTAVLAYERLTAEGYLETRPAQGTFVAMTLPGANCQIPGAGAEAECPSPQEPVRVGCPDPSLFPMRRWRTLMRAALDGMGAFSTHPDLVGDPNLRAAIAAWLSTSRGIAVSPDQVILTNDRSQALHLVAHLTLRPGVRVVIEAPSHDNDTAAYFAEWAELVRVPVDADGICTSKLPFGRAVLVHVSPEHQRLLGARMSASRRAELLDWAAQSSATVLEDDTQSELHYGENSTPRLFSLDQANRVILLGGFCASLGPWVHLAYLVVPPHLVDAASAARRMLGDESGRLHQAALYELLRSGWYARHLHRLSKVYAIRRDALLGALRRHFPKQNVVWGDHAGLHVAWFANDREVSAPDIAALARRCGLEAKALQNVGPAGESVVLIGFGVTAEHLIDSKIARLATMIARFDAAALAAE